MRSTSFAIISLLMLPSFSFAQNDIPSPASVRRLRDAHVMEIASKTFTLPDTLVATYSEFTTITNTRTGFQFKTVSNSGGASADTTIVDYNTMGLVRALAKRSRYLHQLTRYHYDIRDSVVEVIVSARVGSDTSSGTEEHQVNTFDSYGHHLQTHKFRVGVMKGEPSPSYLETFYYDTAASHGNWRCDSIVLRTQDGNQLESTVFHRNERGQIDQVHTFRSRPDGGTDTATSTYDYDEQGNKISASVLRTLPVQISPEEIAKQASSGVAPPPPVMLLQKIFEEHFDARGNSIESITYGPNGNILSSAKRMYNPMDEITSVSQTVHQMEPPGGMQPSQTPDVSDVVNYIYDKDGNLLRSEDFHNGEQVSYTVLAYKYAKK